MSNVQAQIKHTASSLKKKNDALTEQNKRYKSLIVKIARLLNDTRLERDEIRDSKNTASGAYAVAKRHPWIFWWTYALVAAFFIAQFIAQILIDNKRINVDEKLEIRRQNMEQCAKLYERNRFTKYCIRLSETPESADD